MKYSHDNYLETRVDQLTAEKNELEVELQKLKALNVVLEAEVLAVRKRLEELKREVPDGE